MSFLKSESAKGTTFTLRYSEHQLSVLAHALKKFNTVVYGHQTIEEIGVGLLQGAARFMADRIDQPHADSTTLATAGWFALFDLRAKPSIYITWLIQPEILFLNHRHLSLD